MTRPPLKGTVEWELGQWGEQTVRKWLEMAGLFVVPTSLIEDGGAPALTRLLERFTLPDFQTFDPLGGHWWEVKTKSAPVWHQKSGQYRHGIDEHLWEQYLAVEQQTGLPGHLAIVQLTPRMLLAQSFQTLNKWVYPHQGSTAAHGTRLVWWNINDFEQAHTFGDLLDVETPTPPPIQREPRPWDHTPEIGDRQPRLWDD